MAFWLLKSEPGTFSWADQLARGKAGEPWTGVRNHQAKLNLMRMKKGDHAFFYHSVEEKQVVGIVEVIREAFPDPTAEQGAPWVAVQVAARIALKNPVTLEAIKKEPALKEMVLVKHTRLSVQPVSDTEWAHVCRMGGVER
ncbi:MAG TPA: EVE domain-containing protein [Micropepsaceae bacterium]|nr:EVE domain-containing protein [Micropepsaceae bacterium]